MFRRTIQITTLTSFSSFFTFCNWNFDTKGFQSIYPPIESLNISKSLLLTGVGMRRKNLYLVDIDVYLASLSLSPNAIQRSKEWYEKKDSNSVADVIIGTSEGGNIPQPIAIVTLRFQREVDSKTFVLGFNDVFSGLPSDQLSIFHQQLKASIGDGAKKGDDISLVFMEGGSVKFVKNGIVGETFSNSVFEKRLLEAYVDSKRAVSPELVKSVEENIPHL